MIPNRKTPNPKFDYLKSKRNAMKLVHNIKSSLQKQGYDTSDIDVWCEKEELGKEEIWVVRSNIAQQLINPF